MLIHAFSKGVHVTLCRCAQCTPWTNPIPTEVPLPGRTAHRTAGINLGSAGPRPNTKGTTRTRGFGPEGSMQTHISDSTISEQFFLFPSIFKINQFVGQSETWDRRFESKRRIDAFRRVHK